jgi:hypothetical protein
MRLRGGALHPASEACNNNAVQQQQFQLKPGPIILLWIPTYISLPGWLVGLPTFAVKRHVRQQGTPEETLAMSVVMKDVGRSEELGRRFLASTFDFLCHIHSANGGTTTQQRTAMCLRLPPAILHAAEQQLARLPRQDAAKDASVVGNEPFVGDPVAQLMQSWFQPTIVYYDGRRATK